MLGAASGGRASVTGPAAAPQASPGAPPRVVSYLRLSVTDRCNLRCVYCMPEAGVRTVPHAEILTFDEIIGILEAVAPELGLRGIRVTGGEPLVRAGLVELVRRLARLPGVDELSLTTNALLLPRFAGELRAAGLARVNISLDTLRPERYRAICRGGDLEATLAGIRAAEEAGLVPLKINMVVIPGVNDDEVEEMARMTVAQPWHVRFIEFMPVGNARLQRERRFIPSAQLRARIQARFGLEETPVAPAGRGPARYWRIPGAAGTVGFISPLSQHFCAGCNRIRLTADGWVRTCLLTDRIGVDVKAAWRSGVRGEGLVALFREAIRLKPASHDLVPEGDGGAEFVRTMCQIGG
ncbi:MAG TPA: GTP 3',8-cyclase MoaA [bacterium]